MSNIVNEIDTVKDEIIKIVFSQPEKGGEYEKAVIRPITVKGTLRFQAERFKDKKAYHTNLLPGELSAFIGKELDGSFCQVLLETQGKTVHYHKKQNGNYGKKVHENSLSAPEKREHNREKEYILREGENIPALIELGIFTPDFRVVKAKYDKFKQINRFIELVDDEFGKTENKSITILDFGCGKSYLTFILYYYFTEKRKMNTKIIGYDLKKDVVNRCNEIAERYGYDNLHFVVADVTKDRLYNEKIDMIVTLHACDTATDYALDYAIKHRVDHIFSVPCCQHEINAQIQKGGDLDILLKHGIIKERMSALLTDSIRAELLEDMGYKVDMIEFIDFAHSPKNIMIRGRRTGATGRKGIEEAERLCEKYGFKQTLLEKIKESL